jgi:hypothetical protein
VATIYDPVTQSEYPDLPFLPENGGLALPWFRANELIGLESSEIAYHVHELIPAESISLLVGSPGTGKSYWTLDLGICTVLGLPFLGRKIRQGKVMILAAEDGWRRMSRRLGEWTKANNVSPDGLHDLFIMPTAIQIAGEVLDGDGTAFQQAWSSLQDDVERIDPVLVILDPLVETHAGLDENKASDMAALLRTLRKLVRGKDRTLVITHHDKKGVAEPSVYSGRGSSAIAGAVDSVYHMVAAANDGGELTKATLHITKGRDLPPPLKRPVGMRMEGLHWYPDDGVRPSRTSKALEQNRAFHEWLCQQSMPVTISEANDAMGVSYNTAKVVLNRLVDSGAVHSDGGHPERFSSVDSSPDRCT